MDRILITPSTLITTYEAIVPLNILLVVCAKVTTPGPDYQTKLSNVLFKVK